MGFDYEFFELVKEEMFREFGRETSLFRYFVNLKKGTKETKTYLPISPSINEKIVVFVELAAMSNISGETYKFCFSWVVDSIIEKPQKPFLLGSPSDWVFKYQKVLSDQRNNVNDGIPFENEIFTFSENEPLQLKPNNVGIQFLDQRFFKFDPLELHLKCLKPILFLHRFMSNDFEFIDSKMLIPELIPTYTRREKSPKTPIREDFLIRLEHSLIFNKDKEKDFVFSPVTEIYQCEGDNLRYLSLSIIKSQENLSGESVKITTSKFKNFVCSNYKPTSILNLVYKNWSVAGTLKLWNMNYLKEEEKSQHEGAFFEEIDGKYKPILADFELYQDLLDVTFAFLESWIPFLEEGVILWPYEVLKKPSFPNRINLFRFRCKLIKKSINKFFYIK